MSPVSTAIRVRVAPIAIEDEERDRLGRVAGRFERLESHAAEIDRVAVLQAEERVLGLGARAEADGRPDPIAELEVAGEEVGVQVREHHVRDAEVVLRGSREVLLDVALGIDDDRLPGRSSPTRYEACARQLR